MSHLAPTAVNAAIGTPTAAIPARVNRDRIAATRHSYGATTARALLGARVLDHEGNPGEDMSDVRVAAGVLLALAGTGGDDLTPFAAETFPFMSFAEMTSPALVVAGNHDRGALYPDDDGWSPVRTALQEDPHPVGRLESK